MSNDYEAVLAQILLDGRITKTSNPYEDIRCLRAYTPDWGIAWEALIRVNGWTGTSRTSEKGWKHLWDQGR
jgi:hypothetical protein